VQLSNHDLQVSIPVSTRTDEWIADEVLREEFVHSQKYLDAVDATAELESNWEAATSDLFACFGRFVAGSLRGDLQSSHARTSLLHDVYRSVLSSYFPRGTRGRKSGGPFSWSYFSTTFRCSPR
jgi:fatty acid synthase subunit alpha, fungi type